MLSAFPTPPFQRLIHPLLTAAQLKWLANSVRLGLKNNTAEGNETCANECIHCRDLCLLFEWMTSGFNGSFSFIMSYHILWVNDGECHHDGLSLLTLHIKILWLIFIVKMVIAELLLHLGEEAAVLGCHIWWKSLWTCLGDKSKKVVGRGCGWVHEGRSTIFSDSADLQFEWPETEIPQNVLTSNFMHNHSKSWTCMDTWNKSHITHLIPQATGLLITPHTFIFYQKVVDYCTALLYILVICVHINQ